MPRLKESEVAKSFRYDNGRLWRVFKKTETLMQSFTANGYRRIRFKVNYYLEHRIVFAMFYGDIPKGMDIDHINGDKSDNRIQNLRLATRSENNQNTKKRVINKTGLVGVYKNRTGGKFAAAITKDNTTYRSKSFDTKEEAFEEYKRMSVRLFGEYSIYNVINKNPLLK